MRKLIKFITFQVFIFLVPFHHGLLAQDISASGPYQVIIESIDSLESNKDPKCHATASRLENFMFGTPLTPEAREYRIDLQKQIVRFLWTKLSMIEDKEISEETVLRTSSDLFDYSARDNDYLVGLRDGKAIKITFRDFNHYSSVAYSLRAILSVQQEDMLGQRALRILKKEEVDQLKFLVDLVTIGVLKRADLLARENNKYEVESEDLDYSWNLISKTPLYFNKIENNGKSSNYELTLSVIGQKAHSYEQYNQLSSKIFLRNIQVYFAQVRWPSDSLMTQQLVGNYQESILEFASKLLLDAHKNAAKKDGLIIDHQSVRFALNALLPHSINEFEDVTFFTRFGKDSSTVIESYDLDAFRDSGVHWNYLETGIRNNINSLSLEPDPYALELLVEGIAQMGVLIWRTAGQIAKESGNEVLLPAHVDSALEKIKALSRKYNTLPEESHMIKDVIKSTKEDFTHDKGQLFNDVTVSTGITFTHKTSDWLSRKIRSYVFKKDENLARMGIPPAFGGGGVAAEDINNDGFADILFLGGQSIKLYKNNGDKTFTDITKNSGLLWKRLDGTYGEARQPIMSDFDNDGITDIFISYVNDEHSIFKGNGDGTFIDYTAQANFKGTGRVGGPCTAFDFDKDGLLDLYIGYFGNYLEGELPTLKRHNTNGEPNELYRNLGDFKFERVANSGTENKGWTQAVGHADINNDGWQDLIVGNDFGVNAYYINNGDGTFTDKSVELGVDKPSYTMNVGFTDLNADDLPDFYISNIVVMEKDDKYTAPNANTRMHFDPEVLAKMRVVEANDLFISEAGPKMKYNNSKSIGRGYSSTGWAWDADFFDYDNDGDDDLYCLNGMNQYSVYSTQNEFYVSPEGEDVDIVLAQSQEASNVFFENNNGFLQNRSAGSGLDLFFTSRSAAYLDYDNDGDLDVVLNNYNGPAYFFENKSEELTNNWIALDLKHHPEDTIKSSLVGTTVRITTPDDKSIWRQVSSTTGYLSGHPSRIHVGLHKSRECTITVRWPNGKLTQKKILDVNRIVEIEK